MKKKSFIFIKDQTWFKNAIIYEVHVKSFHDSNHDGIGDFKGLTHKLDYLVNLGVDAIWLLPFYPSPLKDDGYDISNYYDVHPSYGTLKDFSNFLQAAHQRGIRVITELILNHTSDEHPWFQKSRRAKVGSKWHKYYVWSKTPNKYEDARIIFTDSESSNWSWDPLAKAYYWHRFYSHQPDLNYENPHIQKEIIKILDFWLSLGVDGFRLDAIPYLFEKEGTLCENLPETHEFLKKLRAYISEKYPETLLIGEANQWPEDAAAYFGKGDECQMLYHFPLMPRLFMGLWTEDTFPISDILMQTPLPPEGCQWALFLRNHDELTLEMVTDEERDYMYRAFAKDPKARLNVGIRRRLAPLLENHRPRIELMNVLLFSLPGTPFIYYGDEIGMGDNYYLGDRDGVRTPMQWNTDRNAGFSNSNPQELYLPLIIDPQYHHETVNVENQEKNLSSLLWWMRRIIFFRHRHKAFACGSYAPVAGDNPKILSFIRQYSNETILVVVNLSRFSQAVELNLSNFSGYTPYEVFSQNKFPVIQKTPYSLTINSFGYYWFSLEQEKKTEKPLELIVNTEWREIFQGLEKKQLEKEILPRYLQSCSWFLGKDKVIRLLTIKHHITTAHAEILIIEIDYSDSSSEFYLLPIAFEERAQVEILIKEAPQTYIATVRVQNQEGFIYDGFFNENFRSDLLSLFNSKKKNGTFKHLSAHTLPRKFNQFLAAEKLPLNSTIIKGDKRNTAISYQDKFFLKLYRRIEEDINPEAEMSEKLTSETNFKNTPTFIGALECYGYKIGVLQEYVAHQTYTFNFIFDNVLQFYERILAKKEEVKSYAQKQEQVDLVIKMIGEPFIEAIRLLGQRTAEMHLALFSLKGKAFTPELFTKDYQRSRAHAMINLVRKNFLKISENKKAFKDSTLLEKVLQSRDKFIAIIEKLNDKKFPIVRFRVHNDLHLGQVLYTGKDFIFIDFEGEVRRPFTDRRIKRSVFPDLCGILYSFYESAETQLKHTTLRAEDTDWLTPWAEIWEMVIGDIFLLAYRDTTEKQKLAFLPRDSQELELLLKIFSVEKGAKALGNRYIESSDQLNIPLKFLSRFIS